MKKEDKNIYKLLRESTETDATPALTQDELSAIFKEEGNPLSQSVISKLENCKREPPTTSLDVIKAYTKHFDVTADYLLGIRKTKSLDEDLAMIEKATGLSDISIKELKKCDEMQLDIFNRLVATGHISKLINAFIDFSPATSVSVTDNDLSYNEYKILKAIELLLKQIFADTDFCKKVNHYKTERMREYYAQYANISQESDTKS